jgi:excisionase family DNA binding protein
MAPGRNLASIRTAADAYDCSDKTIRRYIATGRLTGYRFGPRAIKVDLAEVERLLRPIPTAAGDVPQAS